MNGSHLAIGAVAALAAAGALSRRGSLLLLGPPATGGRPSGEGWGGRDFDNQRLRNLTTSESHTNFHDLTEDLRYIFGDKDFPRTFRIGVTAGLLRNAIKPWLMAQGLSARFWNERYDPSHTGVTWMREPTPAERQEMQQRYQVAKLGFTGF